MNNNKEEMKEIKQTTMSCYFCNKKIRFCEFTRHKKTKRCKTFQKSLTDEEIENLNEKHRMTTYKINDEFL